MSTLNKTTLRVSPLTRRIVLARFGKDDRVALEKRDATSEFWQTLASYAFGGEMPNKGEVSEIEFGGGDEQFVVRIERKS